MSGPSYHRAFYATLNEVIRRYGGAMNRYERAMLRGNPADADEAIGDMQAIEKSVMFIERAGK